MQEYADEIFKRNKRNLIILIWVLNKKNIAFYPLHSISKHISDMSLDIIKPYTTQSVSKQLIRILMKLNQAYLQFRREKIKDYGKPKNFYDIVPETGSAIQKYYVNILKDTIHSLEKLYDFTTFRNVLIRIVTKIISLNRIGITAWSEQTHRYNVTLYRYRNVTDEEVVDAIIALSGNGYITKAKKHMNDFVNLVKNGYFEQYIYNQLQLQKRRRHYRSYTRPTEEQILCLFGIAKRRKDAFLNITSCHKKYRSFEESNFLNIHKELLKLKADMGSAYTELNKILQETHEYKIASNANSLELYMNPDYVYYNTLSIQKNEKQGLFFINEHGDKCFLPSGSGFMTIIDTEKNLFRNNLFNGNKKIENELKLKINYMKKIFDQLSKI